MIQEDFVSFETAKLLKEKGFDIYVRSYYEKVEYKTKEELCLNEVLWNWNISSFRYSAPTLQMAMKWLREVHNLALTIEYFMDEENGNARTWRYDILNMDTYCNKADYRICRNFTTYEQACKAAIRYCLENLI